MSSKIYSATISGLGAQIIEVEVDIGYGLPSFNIVGLPDKAVQESKERVGAAIKSMKFSGPLSQPRKTLVNLAPADLKKEGSLYDLPIALGFLMASEQTKFNPENKIFLGELSLDGKIRPAKGALSIATEAQKQFSEIILPKANAIEASFVFYLKTKNKEGKKLKVIGVETLQEAINHLEGKKIIKPTIANLENFLAKENDIDDGIHLVQGQEFAKRALEIVAAGSHHLLMTGPPGTGKTLLAKSLASLMPNLSPEESLEITKIYSVAGLLPPEQHLITKRPFRSPHHTTSETALIGGGNPPRPGEITLAHKGVLFLDEFPEFHRDVLESLRQPMEEGRITILRAKHFLSLPSRFSLVAAANPCPCGHLNNPEKHCICSGSQLQMYKRKLSGPLVDRIDILIEVPQLKYEKLVSENNKEEGIEMKERIMLARNLQKERFKKEFSVDSQVNSEMTLPQIKKYCQINPSSHSLLKRFVDSGKLSARGYHRTLKIARTIADLDSLENISQEHVSEALMYRIKEI